MAATAMLAAGAVLYACVKLDQHLRYDGDDPDYRYIAAQVGEDRRPKAVDISKINGGDWQFLCLIGSYNHPAQILRDEAARRQIKLELVTPNADLGFIDDPESAIALVDGSGRGRIVLVGDFKHLTHQHTKQCFGPETREVLLPSR